MPTPSGICEWPDGCGEPATHAVTVRFPEMAAAEEWVLCRPHDRELKTAAVRSRPRIGTPKVDEPPLLEVHCRSCDRLLDEDLGIPVEQHAPCPDCSSTQRLVKVVVSEQLTMHDSIVVHVQRPGRGGWIVKLREADDYVRVLEGWGRRELRIDREKDRYWEVIHLPDGSRIESYAALSDHRG
jgi:hypothetical protein